MLQVYGCPNTRSTRVVGHAALDAYADRLLARPALARGKARERDAA